MPRSAANVAASSIEQATSGYSGSFGNFVAGVGGFYGSLTRSVGNILGGIIDVPGGVEGSIQDISEAVAVGRERGVALGVGQFVGTNQIAAAYVGTDINGQQVDRVEAAAVGIGKLSGTVLAAATPFAKNNAPKDPVAAVRDAGGSKISTSSSR